MMLRQHNIGNKLKAILGNNLQYTVFVPIMEPALIMAPPVFASECVNLFGHTSVVYITIT